MSRGAEAKKENCHKNHTWLLRMLHSQDCRWLISFMSNCAAFIVLPLSRLASCSEFGLCKSCCELAAIWVSNLVEKLWLFTAESPSSPFKEGFFSACVITQLQTLQPDKDETDHSFISRLSFSFFSLFALIFSRCINLTEKPNGVSPGLPDSSRGGCQSPQSSSLPQTLRLPDAQPQPGDFVRQEGAAVCAPEHR